MPNRLRLSSLITAASLIGGCIQSNPPAPPPTTAPSTAENSAPSGWETVAPGLERRSLQPGGSYSLSPFTVLRIDPAVYTFRAHYQPGTPLNVTQWRDQLPGAAAFINANFFSLSGDITGLLVSDGTVYGQSYTDRGGMLSVQGDQVRVRSLLEEPYQGEPLDQAVQAFPMLVSGGMAAFNNPSPDRASRRTVIGQDTSGRILFIVSASLLGMRLTDLSTFLASADLELVNAVNMDGGGSTLFYLNSGSGTPVVIPSFDPVPAVLAIYPR